MTDETIITGAVPEMPTPESTNDVLAAAPVPQDESGSAPPTNAAPETDQSVTNLTMSVEDTGILDRIAEMLADHAKAVGEQLDSFLEREIAPLKEQVAGLVAKIEDAVLPVDIATISGPSSQEVAENIERRVAKIEGQIRHIV